MFRLIILFLIINFSISALAEEVSNAINAVNYFSGRNLEIEKLKHNLNYYKKASIVGISGIGKTQLIRKFVQNNNYKLVWFFDCNRDFDAQYLNLAKHINQTIEDKNLSINEDYAGIRERVLDYLKPKKDWLLVYDNLKLGQNDLIKDVIELEANGNIIIGSQDGTNLPYATYLQPLKEIESIEVIHKILPDKQHANHLIDSAKGYPLLVARGAMLLKADSYLSQNYKQVLLKQESSIKSYIKLLMSSLSSSEKDLLYKISVINYQNFSKNFLQKIIYYPDKFEQDLHHLVQLGLIINTKSTDKNEIFEMHEAIREQIIFLASPRLVKDIVSKTIVTSTNLMPASTTDRYLTFVNDHTIIPSFEKLLFNAELYKIDKSKILSLREKLITFYVRQKNFFKCKEMADWLPNYQNNYWQLWLMTEKDKAIYASYLNRVSLYEEWYNKDFNSSINLKNKAKNILMNIKNEYECKHTLFVQIAQSYIGIGDIEAAKNNIILAEQFIEDNYQREMIWFLEARIFLAQGNFIEALNAINNNIEMNKNLPLNTILSVFLYKARILNYLKNYQEAYDILHKIYLIEKDKKQYSDLLVAILGELSRALIGMKQNNTAFQYAKNAKDMALIQHEKLNISLLLSQSGILASALKTEADCLTELGNYNQAITLYAQAEAIFYNIYRENMKNNPLISFLYFNGTKAACKLKDKFWFNKFKRGHLVKFGLSHPKSIELQSMQCF